MTSAVTIRVDSDLKTEVEELFDDIGLNMTTAITCFFKKCVALQGIPFVLSTKTRDLSESLKLPELEELNGNSPKVKTKAGKPTAS